MTNEQIIKMFTEKGYIVNDSLDGGGRLNPEQADKFIDYVIEETVLKNSARVVRFKAEQMTIPKIGVGRRVAVPVEEAADPKLRRGITTDKVILEPKEFMVPFEISDDFDQYNVEGMDAEDHIMKLFATQFANNLEELNINGDVLGQAALESDLIDGGDASRYVKDTFLAKTDGWLRYADGANIYDGQGNEISPSIFSKMLNVMPTKFKRNRANLRFFVSPTLEQDYRETVAGRATAAGDVALNSTNNLTPFGVQLVPLPLLEDSPTVVQHISLTGTDIIPLRYENISSVVVLPSDLYKTPTTPYIESTDYDIDLVNGTIANTGTGAITNGQIVKVTYASEGQVLLTEFRNFIIGIGRDIRVETDRDIYKRVDQFAMTIKIVCQFEELSAIVKGINISGTTIP